MAGILWPEDIASALKDRRERAIRCLEDGELDMCERMCIHAEIALTKA